MLALLMGSVPALIGLLTSFLPNLVKYLENGQKNNHEIALAKLRMEAARQGMDQQLLIEDVKATVKEGESLRRADSVISNNKYINNLRASVRPVITYAFFALFVTVKLSAATLLWRQGFESLDVLKVVWDPYTVSAFGAILGYYFGTRSMIYVNERFYPDKRDFKTVKK